MLFSVGHRAGFAGLERQARPGAIERLDPGLLVDGEHDRVLRRVDVDAYDVVELGREPGIVRALEGADAMRLQIVRRPDPLHRAQADPRCRGHRAAAPMGRRAGWLGAGQGDHPVNRGVAQRRLAGLAGGVAEQAVDAGLGEALLPAPHCGPADPRAPGNLGDAQPHGRSQNDPRPHHMLWGAVAIGHDRLQTSTIGRRDHRINELSHAPSIAHLPALAIHLFASNPVQLTARAGSTGTIRLRPFVRISRGRRRDAKQRKCRTRLAAEMKQPNTPAVSSS